MDVFKRFYPDLLEILPVDDLVIKFFAKGLLSGTHKDKLDGLSTARATNKEKAKYFLDNVIGPGLKIGFMQQFDEMLLIMAKSDDPSVKFLGNEITKSRQCGVTEGVTPQPTTAAAAQEGRSQYSHLQGGVPSSTQKSNKLSPKPTYTELIEQLDGVVSWKTVAAFLLSDKDGSKVEIIARNSHHNIADCCSAMIREYCKSGNVSWESVLEALNKAGEINKATKIKELLYS